MYANTFVTEVHSVLVESRHRHRNMTTANVACQWEGKWFNCRLSVRMCVSYCLLAVSTVFCVHHRPTEWMFVHYSPTVPGNTSPISLNGLVNCGAVGFRPLPTLAPAPQLLLSAPASAFNHWPSAVGDDTFTSLDRLCISMAINRCQCQKSGFVLLSCSSPSPPLHLFPLLHSKWNELCALTGGGGGRRTVQWPHGLYLKMCSLNLNWAANDMVCSSSTE